MKRYFIEDAKCGVTGGGVACGPVGGSSVASIKFREDDGESKWISLVEVDGFPEAMLSDRDVFDDLIKEDIEDEEFMAYSQEHWIHDFNGIKFGESYYHTFASIFEDNENPAIPLIKYLIVLAQCSRSQEEELISMAIGKYADTLDIPHSDAEVESFEEYFEISFDEEEEDEEDNDQEDEEEEDEEDDESDEDDEEDDDDDFEDEEDVYDSSLPDDLDQESLYRVRLFLETDTAMDTVFHDMDTRMLEAEQEKLEAAIDRCEHEDGYKAWKEAYLSEQYEALKDHKFITFKYLFAGVGQYKHTVTEEQRDDFIAWIGGNGSAFCDEGTEATKEEILDYIALRAADNIDF